MGFKKPKDSLSEFEQEIKKSEKEKYVLRLYIAGMSSKSKIAIQNIKRICEGNLSGHYDLEIIDVYKQPVLAEGDQIVATPTLIKKLPVPIRTFIGDMSKEEKILIGLDLRQKKFQ